MHGQTKYHPAGSGAVCEVHVSCISKVWHVPPQYCDSALSDQLHPHFPVLTTIVLVFFILAGEASMASEASVPQYIDVGQEEEEDQEEKTRPEPSAREIIGPLPTCM